MSVKEFLKIYNEKLVNDKDIAENPRKDEYMYDFRDRITFVLSYKSFCPAVFRMSMNPYATVLELDSEDLEYLANKYKQRLKEEMLEEISKVAQSYKDLL